jgi:hypothetical protein
MQNWQKGIRFFLFFDSNPGSKPSIRFDIQTADPPFLVLKS